MPDLFWVLAAGILLAVVLSVSTESARRARELERLQKLDQQLRDAYEARRRWEAGERPDAT